MIIYERQEKILEYLKQNRHATIKELSAHVWASESSVRRDVKALEQRGLLKQTYGGVILPDYQNVTVPVDFRDRTHSQIKDSIAKKAAERIFDGATVIIDGSSTARRIIQYVDKQLSLKIITNNAKLIEECTLPHAELYCTGGLFVRSSNIFVGRAAENYINSINADILFFSSQAISLDGEISDSSEEEVALRKVMLSRSKQRIFVCDASKIGQKRTFTLCHKDDVDQIICDTDLPW